MYRITRQSYCPVADCTTLFLKSVFPERRFPYHHNRVLYRLLVSKKSKKHIAERRPHLEKSYPGVSSDTTRISDIRKGKGFIRDSAREDKGVRTFLTFNYQG
ncbi:unnamed protein product [Rhizophagus irregularis]|nr:unnamed protein product [Rhizophagus irregularis]CAB4438896.1 unnamed protein product [Rhizophagus irregularis]